MLCAGGCRRAYGTSVTGIRRTSQGLQAQIALRRASCLGLCAQAAQLEANCRLQDIKQQHRSRPRPPGIF